MIGEALLLRALRGAPLSCLLALALTRRPSGSGWLTTLTGYRKDSVAAALRLLEQLGLAQSEGRYDGWRLTAGAWELSLFGGGQRSAGPGDAPPAAPPLAEDGTAGQAAPALPPRLPEAGRGKLPPSEGDFLALLRSGSSLIDSLYRDSEIPPPLPDSGKAEKAPSAGETPVLPPEAQRVADVLVERTACPRARANRAVAAARAEHYFLSYLEMQIIYWLAYVRQHGRNILSPGHFIASKIEHGEAAPDWVKLDPEEYRQIALLKLAMEEEDEADAKAAGEDGGGDTGGEDTGGEDTGLVDNGVVCDACGTG
jgi:hypothetical protein